MYSSKKIIFSYYVTLIFLASLLAGCPNPAAYREPITRFQQASTVVIEGARMEYGQANAKERDALIDRYASQKKRIDLTKLNDKEIRVLDGDDLAARLDALNALAKHGEMLLTLASSDAPTRAKAAANSLDDAVVKLSESLGRVPSDKFKATAAGIATIGGEISALALDNKIEKALEKAILLSESDIQELLRLLQYDLNMLYERRRSILSNNRVSAVDRFNEEAVKKAKVKQNQDDLLKAKLGIIKAEDDWDTLPLLLGAGPGLDAMAQAHQHLVDYAKSSKTPQDFSDLVDATDAFASRAKTVSDAIKSIQSSK